MNYFQAMMIERLTKYFKVCNYNHVDRIKHGCREKGREGTKVLPE